MPETALAGALVKRRWWALAGITAMVTVALADPLLVPLAEIVQFTGVEVAAVIEEAAESTPVEALMLIPLKEHDVIE
ncbi:hypothetical protein EB061_06405 [bacterium]|nr:hypothetical protein [bacterium]